jgi:hypothetical protein
MLAWILVAVACAQDPRPQDWVEAGGDPSRPHAIVVSGTAELTPHEAFQAALDRAHEASRERLRAQGARLLEARAPFWLPSFVSERVLDDWLRRAERGSQPRVLAREDKVRDHGFGNSWQTWLLVDAEPAGATLGDGRLVGALRQSSRLFVAKCGGTVLLWGFLALVGAWFDRLTRGYMSGRLRLIGWGLGIAVPTAAFPL